MNDRAEIIESHVRRPVDAGADEDADIVAWADDPALRVQLRRSLDPKAIPPFAALRAFVAVGQHGGIRRAADALSLHHGVVSRHLAALEGWLGVPLINKDKLAKGGSARNRQYFTEEGRTYYRRIALAFAELSDATSDVMPRKDEPIIRIWSSNAFAACWLGPKISSFASLHPELEIELHSSDFAPNLRHHEADVYVRYVPDSENFVLEDKDLQFREIGRPESFPVAGGALSEGFKNIGSCGELLKASLLHERDDDDWRSWFQAYDVPVPERLPGARLGHAHVTLSWVERGAGLALSNAFLAAEGLSSGKLIVVRPAEAAAKPIALGAYIFAARRDRWNLPAIAKIRHWLEKTAADDQAKFSA